eukprot:TRINITY_DN8027_c0_g1_i1.p1 TRINITY_DN8027_c0_g1~~TRINITY_DN8027_c0_g1_i1.p1  ORF type:complete len:231 (+),score=-6.09 TRINITY_DN8027_c0_g1_i1:1101-1793(+)
MKLQLNLATYFKTNYGVNVIHARYKNALCVEILSTAELILYTNQFSTISTHMQMINCALDTAYLHQKQNILLAEYTINKCTNLQNNIYQQFKYYSMPSINMQTSILYPKQKFPSIILFVRYNMMLLNTNVTAATCNKQYLKNQYNPFTPFCAAGNMLKLVDILEISSIKNLHHILQFGTDNIKQSKSLVVQYTLNYSIRQEDWLLIKQKYCLTTFFKKSRQIRLQTFLKI